jgi:DNA-binding transcriptional LysR family regulator
LEGTIDAGLVALPVRNESLTVRLIMREPLAVILPAKHPLAAVAEVNPSDLQDISRISSVRSLNPAFHDNLQRQFRKAGFKSNVVEEVSTFRPKQQPSI